MQAQMIPVAAIEESPTNPRRLRNEGQDAELLESVRKHGVLQAVLCRPKGEAFELVVGSRRLRAARAAEISEIPASVREMTDLEVLEVQVVENAQRADVHPLEEAEAFERLHHQHGLGVEEIAAKVGKSKGYVYGRMKLCALGKAGRKAFYAGDLDASVALLVARIPDALQAEAVKAVTRIDFQGDRPSAREAVRILQREFMLQLKDAPFPADDPELLRHAGPCTTCPKRTGNQPELFADVKSADVCTDPPCYRAKADAAWCRQKAAAEANGRKVLEGKRADEFLRGPVVDLGERCWQDPKSRTYRRILGKQAPEPTIVRASDGMIREVAPQAVVHAALKAAGVVKAQADSRGRTEAQRGKAEILRKTAQAAIAAVTAKAPGLVDRGTAFWRWLATMMISEVWNDSVRAAASARSLEAKKGTRNVDSAGALRKWAETASQDELVTLIVELLVRRDAFGSWREEIGASLRAGCEFAGVDLKALRAEVAAQIREKKKARKAGKKAAPKRARRSKAGTCRECGCTDDEACEGGCTWVEPDLCSACEE